MLVGVLVVDLLSMAGITANRNPQCDSSETVHRIFQSSHKTIEILRRRKNRDQSIHQILAILIGKFVQVLFAIGVTVFSVDAHGVFRWCVLNEFSMARDHGVPQSPLCQLSECPTSLLNLVLDHVNCPHRILLLRQSREVIPIGFENHSNGVKGTVVRSVDQFHVVCASDEWSLNHQPNIGHQNPISQ